MKDKANTKGYNLIMLELDSWALDDQCGTIFGGSFLEVAVYALKNGFLISDIDNGVEMILSGDYDAVHFGMYKSPIFPFNYKNKKVA